MRLTVGIPVYNKSEYLSDCIDSVLAQIFDDYEILLWDDGSTDNSGVICDEYAIKHSDKVRVIHSDNTGPLIARCQIMMRARGDYIYFIDADDVLTSNMLFRDVFETIDREKSDIVVFLFCGSKMDLPAKIEKSEVISYIVDGSIGYSLCNKVFSHKLVDENWDYSRYVGMRMGEDLMQLFDILKNAKNISCINKEYYQYKTITDSSIHSFDIRYYDSVKALREKSIEYLEYSISLGEIELDKEEVFRKKIEMFTLSNITAHIRKIKWIKRAPDRKIKTKEYLDMIYESQEFKETNKYVRYLPLKRRVVVYAMNKKRYRVLRLAFLIF